MQFAIINIFMLYLIIFMCIYNHVYVPPWCNHYYWYNMVKVVNNYDA